MKTGFKILYRFLSAFYLLPFALCVVLPGTVQAADYYYTNRSFSAISFNLQGAPPADILNTESKKLNNIVKGSIKTNSCSAVEKKTVFAWGYAAGTGAWNAVANFGASSSNYADKLFDNAGWVRGTKSVDTNWGAFIWTLQNHLSFKSSETNTQTYGSGWVMITNVLVRGLTNYPPMSEQTADWPDVGLAKSNYPGDNSGESKTFQVDLTTYFQLAIPSISISPKETAAAVGGDAVQFTAVGTNLDYGVAWSIDPFGVTNGATIQPSGNSASVTPGAAPQVYKIRAAASNCPDFYAEAELTVFEVELVEEPVQVTRAQSGTITAVVTPSLTPDKVEWVFTGGKGGSKTTTPNLSISVILVDGDTEYTVTCKVTKNSAVAENTADITVNPRTGSSWQITPTCATDNQADWGDFPGFVPLGEERDRVSNDPRIVIPVDGGFTCAQVNDINGPNDGYWYIESTTLTIDQETVINRYTKSGTTPPNPPGTNWHEYNESQSVDADGCHNGIKGHEYKGVGGSGQGHFAFLETKEAESGMDARTAIEKKWHASSQTNLEADAENTKDAIDNALQAAAGVEPSGNWGPNTICCYDFAVSNWVSFSYGN